MSVGSHPSRWAARTVDDAIRIGCLRGLAACQLALASLVGFVDTSLPGLLLVAGHAAAGLGTMVILRRGGDVQVALLALYLLLLVDCVASTGPTDPLAVGTVWLAVVTTGTPALLLRGPPAVLLPGGATAAMAAAVSVLRPEWGPGLPLALVLGTSATWPAALVFRRALDALVARTDDQEVAAERELRRLVIARTAGRELAEDARVLHDSVINTMAAIASGGSWAEDAELVRRRCRGDVQTMEGLLAGRQSPATGLESVHDTELRIRRTGLDDDEFERHAASLSTEARRALSGAVGELVRNAAKHAQAAEVVIDRQRRAGRLVVTVSDDGVGFDGALIPGRGLAESVVSRIESVGGRVEIDSRPGHGATITMSCPVDHHRETADGADDGADEAEHEVERIRRTACWSWAAVVTGAGVLIEVGNRPGRYTWSWAALVLVAALCLAAWRVSRGGRDLPGVGAVLVVAGLPAGYLLGFAGIGSGQDEPYLWHPIGLTPLLVVLLVLGRSRVPLAAGVTAMALTAAAVAVWLWPDDRQTGVIAATLALIQLCQLTAWQVFHESVGRLGLRLVSDQRQAAASRREAAALEAVARARERWMAAGVRASVELLASIAAGDVDPTDPAVRARCDEEERYLRQLSLVSPDLVHLSGWFARALAEARARAVRLTLWSGDIDVEDGRAADQLGRLILAVVASAPREADLTVGLFSDHGAPRLHLVGPVDFADVDRLRTALPDGWAIDHSDLDAQTLVVIRPARAGTRDLDALSGSVG
ncbi:ATP-binding protein [Nocardioides carbamazepini]|uniref:sensor histidine kinase n=1 Tax=Nocardioides carbamazepini TaxID=2854259 RepID=UPI00214A473F|nr:ATP-binding protein [Nocardioides carbamazepini]MCR1784671.1 ATP-binding protein [Nocardioides carbamazepini]